MGARNLLQVVDEHGARQEYYPDFMSRWHTAFLAEMQTFTDTSVPAHTLRPDVYDGTAVSERPIAARILETANAPIR